MRYWLIVGWFMVRDYFDIIILTVVLMVVCFVGVFCMGNVA